MRQEIFSPRSRVATAPWLMGLSAFLACSALAARAFADGSEVVAAVAPESPPPPPPQTSPPEATTPRTARLVALAFGGAAIVAAGSGIAFGVLALNDKSSFDNHPTYHAGDSANENAVLSDVCLGGAVVAAVTSIVLFVKSYEAPAEKDVRVRGASAPVLRDARPVSFTLTPMVTMHGGGAGAALRF